MKTSMTFLSTRSAFTLLELLIVISIIAVLASLSITVLYGLTDQASEEATVATIRKIDAMLEKRIEAFHRVFDRPGTFRDRYLDATRNLLRQDKIFGPLINDRLSGESDSAVVEALAIKVAMRHNFPQRHEDLLLLGFDTTGTATVTDIDSANNIFPLAQRSIDTGYPNGSGGINTSNGNRIADAVDRTVLASATKPHTVDGWMNDSTVSAELLYYFLVHSASLGSSDEVGDQFTSAEIADTDDDGLLEFVDAWGNPLRFYRWPTRMVDTDPAVPFQPVLINLSDLTDAAPVGPRVVSINERLVANIMIKGLPPGPTGLPNGALPRDLLLIDPDDPIGVLYRALEEYTGGAVDLNGDGDTTDAGENDTGVALRTEYNETNYHTPDTYHTPLIMSAGADEELGLYEPSDTANLGNLAAYDLTVGFQTMVDRVSDNLTSRNRRAGGR